MQNWTSPTAKHRFWDTLRFDLEFLYDDIVLYEEPEKGIGYIVSNQAENDILRPVYKALDDVCEQIGKDMPDSAYIDSPLWDKVVETAKAAFDFFMSNEEKACQSNPHPWKGEDNWDQL